MIRLLIRTLIFLASAALGLLVASWLIDDVHVKASGFILVVIVYAVVQNVITPFLTKLAAANAPAFLGGTSLLASFVALVVASLFGDALEINGIAAWIAATVVVWLVTAIASFMLPWILVRSGVEQAQPKRRAAN